MIVQSCRSVVVWMGLLVAGMAMPSMAAAGPVYADLDQDGIADVVSLAAPPAHGLLVWLSASGTLGRLQTRAPLIGIVARDLDGDGRIELVAADANTRLHIWRLKASGVFRHERSPAPGRNSGWTAGPRLGTLRDTPAPALASDTLAPFLPGADPREVALDSRPYRSAPRRLGTPSVVSVPAASRAPPTH